MKWFQLEGELSHQKLNFYTNEIYGSFGDIGTLFPLLLIVSYLNGISLSSSLFLAGIFHIISGFIFRIPIAIQPMKAIATEAISSKLDASIVLFSGFICGFIIILFHFFGILKIIQENIKEPILYGIKFLLAFKLLKYSINIIIKSDFFYPLNILFIFSLILVLLNLKFSIPSAILIFLIGSIFSFNNLHFSFPNFELSIPKFSFQSLKLSLIQAPLTILNSMILLIAIAKNYFPEKEIKLKKLSFSIFFMNTFSFLFNAFPFCHGAGGLVSKYKFGARSYISNIFFGTFLIIICIFFGGSFGNFLRNYPIVFFTPLLFITSFELMKGHNKLKNPSEIYLFLLSFFSMLFLNIFFGFLISLILDKIFTLMKGIKYERESA